MVQRVDTLLPDNLASFASFDAIYAVESSIDHNSNLPAFAA
jgi:hypothetical protein